MKQFTFLMLIIMTVTLSNAQDSKDILLPAPIKTGGKPLMESLNARSSAREFSTKELTLQELSDLLWAANGINRPESGKRTAATARNWQDIDLFVVTRSGIYLYESKENILKFRKAGDYMKNTGKQDFVDKAALNIVIVSNFSKLKTASKEDKMLYAGIHAGSVSQNIYLYCASVGMNTVTRRYLDVDELAKTMELSADEIIILAQTVGYRP